MEPILTSGMCSASFLHLNIILSYCINLSFVGVVKSLSCNEVVLNIYWFKHHFHVCDMNTILHISFSEENLSEKCKKHEYTKLWRKVQLKSKIKIPPLWMSFMLNCIGYMSCNRIVTWLVRWWLDTEIAGSIKKYPSINNI